MNNQQGKILAVASFFGFTAVIIGAMAAHYLRNKLELSELHTLDTGVRFQMYHAIALVGLSILAGKIKKGLADYVFYTFTAGIVLFSFSIYLFMGLGIFKINIPGLFRLLTPLGGISFMLGWLGLFYSGYRAMTHKKGTSGSRRSE